MRFFCERLGASDLVVREFRPTRDDRLVMRKAKRRISSRVIGVELDGALKQRLRLMIGGSCRIGEIGMAAQHVFIGGEIGGGLA